jgi:glucose-6-phosphate dehydrogenase assembly protein OpcA
VAGDLKMATASLDGSTWSAQATTPDAIEAALRELLTERSQAGLQSEQGGLAPARVLNMVVFVESRHVEEIAERLRGVGRYHASRTLVLSYEADREDLNARVSIASEGNPNPGEPALLRETAVVEIGERHLDDLTTIADPLVVSDLPTLLWSPHRHPAAADALLELAQATLIDSIEQPVWSEAIGRACGLSERAYVVDLAWLRSTPWRERVAATFDSQRMRAELHSLERLRIHHHPASTVAAMLFVGWLASRLDWQLGRSEVEERAGLDGALKGSARTGAGGRIELRLQAAPELSVPGLAGVALCSESGLQIELDRGPGGLHERRREHDGTERAWTLLGASRGEGGILGEGIRQALLRDPAYLPALHAAHAMLPDAQSQAVAA